MANKLELTWYGKDIIMTITNNCTHIWRCALLPDNRGYKGWR